MKKTSKETYKQKKKPSVITKSAEDTEKWYYLACKEVKIAGMIQCVECRQWYQEACVGLTKTDLDAFICPNYQD